MVLVARDGVFEHVLGRVVRLSDDSRYCLRDDRLWGSRNLRLSRLHRRVGRRHRHILKRHYRRRKPLLQSAPRTALRPSPQNFRRCHRRVGLGHVKLVRSRNGSVGLGHVKLFRTRHGCVGLGHVLVDRVVVVSVEAVVTRRLLWHDQ
ncbi:hypothetical protein ACHHYP_20335 [Achlya hypogyna]|uniref:Uncharacterized protein n=1 Tax=Achlya hypogyna TaxID=1202772 RepID=A0A1V9YQT3_ACHHY|nr:hypothetical protein ACHHYP_20335 [Achlya hypogyna]